MILNRNNDIDDDKRINLLPLIVLGGIIFLIIIIFLFIKVRDNNSISYDNKLYYITLYGDNKMTVYLNEEYDDPGYSGKDDTGKDLTSKVVVVNNIDNSNVGTYKVSYTLGNITKERIVNVIEKPIGATNIHLYGDLNVFLYVGEKYVEKGYEVIDSIDGAKLNDQVKISSDVDTSKEGIYKVKYSVVNSSGVTTSSERTVIVMDREISLLPSNTEDTNNNVKINIYIKDELFDYLILPNKTQIKERTSSYEVSSNGTYKFIMYNTKGESKEKSITISNIDKEAPSGSCSGTHQNGVTNINVNASDNNGISRYVINGTNYTTNTIKINEELSNVSVTIYDNAGNNKTITCTLTNNNTTKPTSKTSSTTITTITKKTTTTTTVAKQSLNISSSFNDYISSGYSLFIPENATVDMPLFVMVAPSPTSYKDIKPIFTNWKLEKIPAFILIAHNATNYNQIRNNIDSIVSKYSIDKSRISVSGFSSSGTYVYYLLAKNKDLFSGLVVVSSGMTCNYDVIKNNFDYFKNLPTIGFGETGGQYDANGRKCSGYTNWSPSGHMKPLFNCLGMPNNFTDLGKMCHSKVSSYVFNLDNNKDNKSDVIEWAISQTKK